MQTTQKRLSSVDIRNHKGSADRLVVVTAYDYTFARLLDSAADVILVGDSLGMVIQGEANTLSVTVDDIVYHSRAVAKALNHAHLVADMPFMSYQDSTKNALRNAGRLLSEGKAQSVKLEGGVNIARLVSKMVGYGIPVMGHIGLTPQSVNLFGGHKIQGKTEATRAAIVADAVALEEAGAYSIVLEGMPTDLAAEISKKLSIPTIGIGAGPHCDGQVLVIYDLIDLNPEFRPRFVKKYAHVGETIQQAIRQYANEVQQGKFPDETHSF